MHRDPDPSMFWLVWDFHAFDLEWVLFLRANRKLFAERAPARSLPANWLIRSYITSYKDEVGCFWRSLPRPPRSDFVAPCQYGPIPMTCTTRRSFDAHADGCRQVRDGRGTKNQSGHDPDVTDENTGEATFWRGVDHERSGRSVSNGGNPMAKQASCLGSIIFVGHDVGSEREHMLLGIRRRSAGTRWNTGPNHRRAPYTGMPRAWRASLRRWRLRMRRYGPWHTSTMDHS